MSSLAEVASTDAVHSFEELQAAVGTGRKMALILTRGFLHPGHRELVARAKADGFATVLGIFLHPRQFAPGDNPSLYPRDLAGDLERARAYGVDIYWQIGERDVYPPDFATELRQPAIERTLAGVVHPEVLRSQVTLTFRLLSLAGAQAIYFGELDWYKARCVGRALRDLGLKCDVHIVETARDEHGLAYSAMNAKLMPEELKAASRIHTCLRDAQSLFADHGEYEVTRLLGRTSASLTRIPGFRLQYVHLLDPDTLLERERAHAGDLLMIGGFFGRTRVSDAVRLPGVCTAADPSA